MSYKWGFFYFFLFFLTFLFVSEGRAGTADEQATLKNFLKLDQKWIGDFDGMVERRVIRALVTFSKTNYFLDGARQRGATYELLKAFEEAINRTVVRKHLGVYLIIIPVTHDQVIPALVEGLGDIAAAGLTVTAERKKSVDFADPVAVGVNEVVVAGPNAPRLSTVEDLSGKEICVRRSSSYYQSLLKLNKSFKKARKPSIILRSADEMLEDEDLLEMVNAGLIPMTVVDSFLAKFWAKIFTDVVVYPKIAVRTGGQIAWMIRKRSPKLRAVVNDFVKGHKKGTLFGNIMYKRYYQNTKWVRNSLSDEEIKRFKATIDFFKKYAGKYDFDWLMVAALAYQESRIDQSKRSPDGAVGVMQILPSTAASHPINIPDIEEVEKNIHAGVKYLRWVYDNYFEDEDMDRLNKVLFTFASYNAGPVRVKRLRSEAAKMGLEPNVWFRNVEVVAAKKIGRETVGYVSNIYKYYIAYRIIAYELDLKEKSKKKKAAGG